MRLQMYGGQGFHRYGGVREVREDHDFPPEREGQEDVPRRIIGNTRVREPGEAGRDGWSILTDRCQRQIGVHQVRRGEYGYRSGYGKV